MYNKPPASPFVSSDAHDEPPVERAVREASLDLALETGNFDMAQKAARALLKALYWAFMEAESGEEESVVAMFLLLSRRVCDELCKESEREREN